MEADETLDYLLPIAADKEGDLVTLNIVLGAASPFTYYDPLKNALTISPTS